jgi:uncharacterized damage-inducible protein DinB
MASLDEEIALQFIEFSRQKLASEFWPRICTCLEPLREEQVWWRPNESSNSIGYLLLHLNGNARQWIVSALGGAADERNRPIEFSEREHIPVAALRSKLEETLSQVDAVLAALAVGDLVRKQTIQRHENVSTLQAVYHVVEHFAMHYGQILYIVKMLKGEDAPPAPQRRE